VLFTVSASLFVTQLGIQIALFDIGEIILTCFSKKKKKGFFKKKEKRNMVNTKTLKNHSKTGEECSCTDI
jgi:TctA family transporter